MQRIYSGNTLVPRSRVKNVQIRDGADNATLSIFRATESEFGYLFPKPGQDIEIIEDFIARHSETEVAEILNKLWLRPIHKSKALGIHGTLFYDYADKRHHLPASKREIDREPSQINQAERELYASMREDDAAPTDDESIDCGQGSKRRFNVELLIVHTTIDPDSISAALGLDASAMHRAGDPRQTPKATPLPGAYPDTRWRYSVCFEVRDQWFVHRLIELVDTLAVHKDFLAGLRSTGGRTSIILQFMADDYHGDEIPCGILARLVHLGLDIGFEVSPNQTSRE